MKTFFAELYEIDASLEAHESDLIPLIEKLLKNDPSQAPDQRFVAELRTQLKSRASSIRLGDSPVFYQKLVYALGGAVVAGLLLPVAFIAWNNKPVVIQPINETAIEETGSKAFGSLSDIAQTTSPAPMGETRGMGGGGGNSATNPAVPVSIDARGDMKMIMPYPMIDYDYVYSGDLKDLGASVDVYKREPKSSLLPLSSIASSLNLGGFDLGSFKGMQINSIGASQNVQYGYQMYVSLMDSTISIDAQWDKWPMSNCQTDACFQAQRVKIGDIPTDDVLIGIANDFAQEHGVDTSKYGAPEVDNAWRKDYERSTDKANYYIPDSMRVVYPQLIDGKPAFDQSGQKSGMSITVHIKERKVMSVWGIGGQTYTKSQYEGADEAAVKNYLTNLDGYYTNPLARDGSADQPKKATVILGEPTVGYALFYRYTTGKNEELYIPSLIFPVQEVQGDQSGYYRQTVVVPLAKEMLDASINPPMMPMMKGGVEGGPAVDVPAATEVKAPVEIRS